MDDNIFLREDFIETILTKRCVKLKINQKDAAKQIGISHTTLCKIESGLLLSHLNVISYYYCCRWLGMDINHFFRKDTRDLGAYDKIVSAVSLYYDVPAESFFKNDSNLDTDSVHKRAVLFYCIYTCYKTSYQNIANSFLYKSHQPILRLVKIIEKKIKEKDAVVLLAIKEINQLIN